MHRLFIFLVPLSIACSSTEHAAPIGGGCGTSCGGVGGTQEDASAATDGDIDDAITSETGVSLIGKIHLAATFPREPKDGAAQTNVTVRAQRAGSTGETEIAVVALDGSFTLDGIAPSSGIPTWFKIIKAGAIRGYAGVRFPLASADAVDLPIFDDSLPVTTAVSGTVTSGAGTVVIHARDALGNRIAGVTANAIGDAKPYYDSGSDSVEITATATGTHGTIVFLGLPIGAATVTLSWMGKTQPSITVPTGADAISWTTATIE